MAASLMELASRNQACIIAALIMAGTSGPITIAGVLAQQNAEILAGITLAQLMREGAPVIYGATSAPTDMRTGGLSIGAAELSTIAACTVQVARFYGLPCRSGGCLTDSHVPDAQAGVQSCMSLVIAARSGANFILHAAGILGSYIGMSYEKYIIDEELCGMVRAMLKDVPVTKETLQKEVIQRVGSGGQFMTEQETLDRCRTEFFFPSLMNTQDNALWKSEGGKWTNERAAEMVKERLASYEKPAIDKGLEKALDEFVDRVKAERTK
jgi:trimethylamine--corrinoid protein Co-methyltransferase